MVQAVLTAVLLMLTAGCTGDVPAGPPGPTAQAVTSIDVAIRRYPYPDQPSAPAVEYTLVRDAGRLVEFIEGQSGYDASDGCPADAGPIVDLIVHRGAAVLVLLQTYGCELVQGWGEDRTGAEDVYGLLLELLEQQRIATPDPGAAPAACPDPLYGQLTIGRDPTPTWDQINGPDPTVTGPPYPAVGARVCRYDRTNAGPTTERLLLAAEAEALRGEVVGDLTLSYYPCPLETVRADVVVFVDEAGGSFEVRIDGGRCHGLVSGANGFGRAGLGLLEGLDRALG